MFKIEEELLQIQKRFERARQSPAMSEQTSNGMNSLISEFLDYKKVRRDLLLFDIALILHGCIDVL